MFTVDETPPTQSPNICYSTHMYIEDMYLKLLLLCWNKCYLSIYLYLSGFGVDSAAVNESIWPLSKS
jgi:hypothetical protein